MSTPEAVFNNLLNSFDLVEVDVGSVRAPATFPDRYKRLYEAIVRGIFPSKLEDYSFFQSVWESIKTRFLKWNCSSYREYRLFISLMQGELSLQEFSDSIRDEDFLWKLRKYLYTRSFDKYRKKESFDATTFSYLEVLYESADLAITTFDFEPEKPEAFVQACIKYYDSLGYTVVDGSVVSSSSQFYLASKNESTLSPQLFNSCLFPWLLEESITGKASVPSDFLKALGWQRRDILNELVRLGALEKWSDAARHTFPELIALYRRVTLSDCYISWDIVRKYRYLKYTTLLKLARETFGESEDTLGGLSYDSLIDRLVVMSDMTMELRKTADTVLDEAGGMINGVKKAGYSYILSSYVEGKDGAVWYPNLEGRLCLLFNNVPFPRDMIPVTYEVYTWARDKGKDISIGYLIFVAQSLGIWEYIMKTNESVTSKDICDSIDELVSSIKMSL